MKFEIVVIELLYSSVPFHTPVPLINSSHFLAFSFRRRPLLLIGIVSVFKYEP